MKMLFVDSSYLIGLFVKNDGHHEKAEELKININHDNILINNVVFSEVMNSFKIRKNKANYTKNIDNLFNFFINNTELHYLTKEDYVESYGLFKYYNQSINYSDCTILYTMQKYKINKIVSFDSYFDKINAINRIFL